MVGPGLVTLLLTTLALSVLFAVVFPCRLAPAFADGQALSRGWNGLVYDGPQLPPKQAFASLADALGSAYYLASVNGTSTWQYYLPAFPDYGTLKEVQPMKAYWVNMNAAATFIAPAFPTPTPTPSPSPPLTATATA